MLFNFSNVKSPIRLLTHSNIWVAFCALGLTLSSEIILQTSSTSIAQFVFFATIFAYNIQRIIRIKKGGIHPRKKWLIKNKMEVYFLMLIAFIGSLYYFCVLNFITQITIVFTAVLSLAYPFIRSSPFVKIFVISFVWTISTMLFLILENNIVITQNIILHLASRFLFVFAITIPFDIRDLECDFDNIKTIPMVFGEKHAKWIANCGLLICVIILIFQYTQNNICFPNFLALFLTYFLSGVLIIKSDKSNNDIYFSFWVESLSFLCYVFLVVMLLIF